MKTLINKLIDKVRKGVLVAAAVASLGIASCDLNGNKPNPVNYSPVITSFPSATEINEGNSYNYNVNATDSDGDSLEYSLVAAPSWLSINPNSGMISGTAPQVDADTGFNVEAGVSDKVNPIVKQAYTLTVKNVIIPPEDFLNVEGYLQDNETDTGKQGTIKIYDSAKQFIGQTSADSNGHFTFHSDTKKATDLSQIIIQAQATSGSYIRTTKANVSSALEPDVSAGNIRVVPYGIGWTSTEVNNFVEHMGRVNFNWILGLVKWNHGELPETIGHPLFKGIEISSDFTSQEQDSIENAIRNSGYLKAGQINIVRGKNHYLELGWGFIRLSNPGEAPGTIPYEQYGSDGYIERFVTNLTHLQATSKGLVNHEALHGLEYTGHADNDIIVALFNSIMKYTSYDIRYSPPQRPEESTAIDIKGNHLIDEPTYQGMELKDDILGTSFY